eukprot:TRINITY_DN22367_c0_g1_i1.p1 TRINITY_DN22367_c0_g1~~TRINITY_DN22367_c0_g1_i1.p1  ORF type:complete len:113 (+),score=14.75 TRINITY_DN22367_c0_g1_i1:51-389(+)
MAARGLYRSLRKLGVEREAMDKVIGLGDNPATLNAGFKVMRRLSMAKRAGQISNIENSISYQRYVEHLLSEAADVIVNPATNSNNNLTASIPQANCPTGTGGGIRISAETTN